MTKEEFAKEIDHLREVISSGDYNECPCPKNYCEWHGNCFKCVLIHRYHKKHVPNCLQSILKDKIETLAKAAELEVNEKELTPEEFWDYAKENKKDS